MRKVLNVLRWAERIVQVYLPAICFCALFIVFNMQVILRYLFNAPTIWSNEFAAIMFVILVMLSSNYSTKVKKHVCFTMLYDAVGETGKHIIDLLGNLLLVVTYTYAFQMCWVSIVTNNKLSSVLKLPLRYVYFPFIILLAFTIFYSAVHMFRATMWLKNSWGKEKRQ